MKSPGRIELTQEQVDGLRERIENSNLSEEDRKILIDLIHAMGWMNQSLEEKKLSIQRLKRIFGIRTEKASHILDTIENGLDQKKPSEETNKKDHPASDPTPQESSKNGNGHGRLSADQYTSAQKIVYSHKALKKGSRCPGCSKGNLVALEYGKTLRITALPPLSAVLHQPERLRCSCCGEIYTAELPQEIGTEKYDESACSMVAVMRYGFGMPMNRLENFQKCLGIPLPAGTQWDLILTVANAAYPVFDYLVQMAAQGTLFHNDDTKVKILSVMNEHKQAKLNGEDPDRTGIFTTGIVSMAQGHKIMLFYSGQNHAGENLANLLLKRDKNLTPPIQMCDALSRNEPPGIETILTNCLTHGRRQFYDLYSVFPDEVQFVIKTLREVYRNDALTKNEGMSDQERLVYHQENSGPHMEDLKNWMDDQINEKKAEPNSSLGKAIQYMKNNWEKLTQFLRILGAPLTNDECERLLKTAILHRKNSLFYKTEFSALVGDIIMSLIQTAKQAGINPFEYLMALQKNKTAVRINPHNWLPWNYQSTLRSLDDPSEHNKSSP